MKLSVKIMLSLLVVAIILTLISGCAEDDALVQSLLDLSGAPVRYDDSGAGKHLNVVTVSMSCSADKEANLQKIENTVLSVAKEYPQTELILFGETILGLYIHSRDEEAYQRSVAESIPGPVTDQLGLLTDSLNIFLGFGMSELKTGKLYNSLVLLNPNGEIEAVHRKVNLTPEDIRSGFTPAEKADSSVTIVTIKDIRTALIVCADVSGFWLTEQITKHKAELILHSLASNAVEFRFDPVARQYNAWAVFANRYGQEGEWDYSGTAYIADPAGTIRTGGDGSEGTFYYRIGVY